MPAFLGKVLLVNGLRPETTGLKPIPFDWSTRAIRAPGDQHQVTIFGGGFQAPSRVTLQKQTSVALGRVPSGRMIEAKAALDEAVRNREAVERQLSPLESLIGPEAVVQALEEAEASVVRERGSYNQVLAEE